jgi:hypothetical protein
MLARDDLFHLAHQPLPFVEGVVAVDDDAQRVHRLMVDQHVELDHIAGPVFVEGVVHAGVAFGARLEFVVEVDDDLRQRDQT